jgi:predicted alpha/beta hydrolase family esterase
VDVVVKHDKYADFARGTRRAITASLLFGGAGGNINSASGIGQWEEARAIRLHFLERLILPQLRAS